MLGIRSLFGFVSALVALHVTLAKSSTGDSVLVFLQPSVKKEDYSIFFGNLKSVYIALRSRHYVLTRYGMDRARLRAHVSRAEGGESEAH